MQYKKLFNSTPIAVVMLAGSIALWIPGQSFAAFCTPKADELFNDKGVVLFDFEKQANCQTALRQLIGSLGFHF